MPSVLTKSIGFNTFCVSPSYYSGGSNNLFEKIWLVVSGGTALFDSFDILNKKSTNLSCMDVQTQSKPISLAGSHEVATNPAIDLQQEKNRQIIKQMSHYPSNWNGYGAPPFSAELISMLKQIIDSLIKQPVIMPTARDSAILQYNFPNGTVLAFEVFSSYMNRAYVPKGNYSQAQSEIISSDYASEINRFVRDVDESE